MGKFREAVAAAKIVKTHDEARKNESLKRVLLRVDDSDIDYVLDKLRNAPEHDGYPYYNDEIYYAITEFDPDVNGFSYFFSVKVDDVLKMTPEVRFHKMWDKQVGLKLWLK